LYGEVALFALAADAQVVQVGVQPQRLGWCFAPWYVGFSKKKFLFGLPAERIGIGRVAPGSYPPGAPTDPHVRTLAHTVPPIMGLLHERTPSGPPSSAGA